MAEESCSSQNTPHTVFVDTNFGTHFVMMVTGEDTVGDFKKRVSTEHHGCFPYFGEIIVHSLKVRRNGCFYHLLNSMLVKSAFDDVKKSWFLHVDADCNQVRSIKEPLYLEAGANFQPGLFRIMNDPSAEVERGNVCIRRISTQAGLDKSALLQAESSGLLNKLVPLFGPDNVVGGMTNIESSGGKFITDDHHRSSSLDGNKKLESEVLEKHDLVSEGNDMPQTNTKHKKEKSKKRKKDLSCNDVLQSGPTVKKPRRSEKKVEDNSGICMSSEDASKPESIFHENSLEGKRTKNVKLGGVPNKLSEADDAAPDSLASGKSKKKRNLSILRDKVDSTLVSSGKKVRPENSKKGSGNIHKELSTDADGTISLQSPGVLPEKEIRSSPVTEIRGGNPILCSSSSGRHGMTAAIGDVDSLQDVYMGGASGSKLESGVEASAKTVEFGVRKTKKSKKHQAANANEVEMVVKDGKGSSDPLDALGIAETRDLDNKREKKSLEHKTANVNEAGLNKKDGIDSSTPLDTSGTIDAMDPENKRGKKSKKNKDADAKSLLHANIAEATIPLTSNYEKAFDDDHRGITKEAGILSQSENGPLSKVCSSNGYTGTDDNDKNEGELVQNEGPKMTPEALSTMSNIKGKDVSDKSFDAAGATEVRDPTDKRKKKSKKTKGSNAKSKVSASGIEYVESAGDAIQITSESHKAPVQDCPSIETKKGDNMMSLTEGHKASEVESMNTRSLGSGDKDYQGSGHEDHTLQLAQVVETQEITDNIDDKVKRKSIKPPASTSDTVMDLGMKQQVDIEDPPVSTKGNKEEEKSTAKKMRKSKSKNGSSVSQSYDITPEAENGSGFRSESLQLHQLSGNVGSPQTPPNAVKYNVGGDSLVSGSVDEVKVPKNDGDEVNFRHYFVPKDANHEIIAAKKLVQKDAQQRDNDNELKVKKKSDTHNGHSIGTTELEKPRDAINNLGHKKKTQSGTLETSQLQSSKLKPHSSENVSVTAGERLMKILNQEHKVEVFPDTVSRNKIVGSSEDITSQRMLQFRSPSGVNVHTSSKLNNVAETKSYIKNTGDILNSSQDRKSFLPASNTNFSGSSTESYEDIEEGEKHNSDASTRSPSDVSSSSSSDHSEGESEVKLNSSGNGSYGRKVIDSGGNKSIKSKSATRKDMDLDAILRSSRSYKKAKLTASQSQPEDETGIQPIQFSLGTKA